MDDLLADTDAYNISKRLPLSSSIVRAFSDYYSSGTKTRYSDFTRHMGKEQIKSLIGSYTNDYAVSGVKWPLLDNVNITPNQSNAVRDAFTDFMWGLVQNER